MHKNSDHRRLGAGKTHSRHSPTSFPAFMVATLSSIEQSSTVMISRGAIAGSESSRSAPQDNGRVDEAVIEPAVATAQIAPTILKVLGLDPNVRALVVRD
jgi:hypothetical protein